MADTVLGARSRDACSGINLILREEQKRVARGQWNNKHSREEAHEQRSEAMDERIPHLQDRQFMEHADFLGVDYPSLYMCKSKRGIKREDGGKVRVDAYKLPHRLIEKKRRDRINECIGQLKDLLPEHLKLSTLGHLEKAVVLELTLKHLNALTAVTEQQHQKIIALQNGERGMKSSIHADLDAFRSGFQACAKEVLQYLSQFENWTTREQRCAQLINHLHKALAQFQSGAPPLQRQPPAADAQDGQRADGQANCVPVIQRTQGGELNENDTDTDSGYGGEAEKSDGKEKECPRGKAQRAKAVKIKQEFGDERAAKKPKMNWSGNGSGGADLVRPDLALMNSLMGISGVGQQTPICMPFYFINPSAAASYVPLLDKSSLEKYVYPAAAALASPFPWLYPAHASAAAAAAAAAAAFPGLSAHFGASPPSKDSLSADSDESHEAEAGSPDEREESPASDDGEGDVADSPPESKGARHEQFPARHAS
ncbi:class E basic helix-loop-helix protein 41 isoform X2 [Betta splendens]|uniref:Class E basic helix-loop-helix protein 41 isoform X2 n=1 Tax=Betta splendens TaxID=158456 RepID=A0A6P7MPU5_BETSP|nr:class E basic helix-loop-helix protein 41 isoform X2 [Betta splendens]